MQLVFVYIDEHKILSNFHAATSSLFNIEFKNNCLSIKHNDEDFSDYYDGAHIKAVIGKNGAGKSSFLDFIEESCGYTESRGFLVWFSFDNDSFYVQDINYNIESVTLDLCYQHFILYKNDDLFKSNRFKIVKVNNINSIAMLGQAKKYRDVVDLSLGRQDKFTGSRKRENLLNLMMFFNESPWVRNQKTHYRYEFNFKAASKTIQKWLFGVFCERNSSLLKQDQENKFQEYTHFIFEGIEPIVEIGSERDVFHNLLKRNIFSYVKALPSSIRIVNTIFSERLAYEIVMKSYRNEYINIAELNFIILSVHKEWMLENKNKVVEEFDSEILLHKFAVFFNSLNELARTIYKLTYKNKLYTGDVIKTMDYDVIVGLVSAVAELPKEISGNFRYGWEGFSTGELAKLNIFASIFNVIRKKGAKFLFIIDEVDLYLHPEWQRTFISELLSFLNSEVDKSSVQFLITTHSPLIIGDFLEEDIISLHFDNNGIPYRGKALGFGTGITDAYTLGMHISSTFGEHSRLKLLNLVKKKSEGNLDSGDIALINKISDDEFREALLHD
ncbi:AAA family ATPase [Serratia marcescens]|uniref:AAA family ATPase n=1 Tax=Serratia marcescens TaxID=615 RepID=UPI0024A720FC|nr:AAA family ATPase [Serratia marcescens]